MYFKSFTKTAKVSGMSRVIIFDIPYLKNWEQANQIFAISFYDTRHPLRPAAKKSPHNSLGADLFDAVGTGIPPLFGVAHQPNSPRYPRPSQRR
jgi:hypothetical protein